MVERLLARVLHVVAPGEAGAHELRIPDFTVTRQLTPCDSPACLQLTRRKLRAAPAPLQPEAAVWNRLGTNCRAFRMSLHLRQPTHPRHMTPRGGGRREAEDER